MRRHKRVPIAIVFLVFAVLLAVFYRFPDYSNNTTMSGDELPSTIYDFTVKEIRGNDVSLSEYKGKVLLIVNVASKCGLTNSNYKELNDIYQKYKDQGQFPADIFP